MMKKLLPSLSSALLAYACTALNAAPPPGNFSLTFEETFDGDRLDGSIWRQGSHDGSVAGYRDSGTGAAIKRENIVVDNGLLKITAQQETATQNNLTLNYSAGEISTFRTFTPSSGDQGFKQTYGYFEARMRWDSVQGLWPAFWTMPDRGQYGYQNYYNRSFLKFDLSSETLPAVTSAVLRLKVADIQQPNPTGNDAKTNTVALGVSDDSWTEGGIKWNNMPTPNPLWLDQSYDNRTVGATVDLDITDFVLEQIADGDQVFSICLTDTLRQWNQIEYHSKEATNAADRPVLIINGSSYPVTADSKVVAGTAANSNYGSLNTLSIWETYVNANNSTGTDSIGQGMEIDILEVLGKWGNKVGAHVLHWDGYSGGISNASTGWGRPPVADTSVFHTYGVYWEPGLIEFYIDGVKTASFANTRVPDVPAYLILSLQTGGWDGNTPSAAINGKGMEVDWVRAWQGTKTGSEPTTTSIDGNGDITIGADNAVYGGSGNANGKITIADDGASFSICKNGWEKFPMSYSVTADTWLEFTVDSSEVGEILAIGLEDNDNISDSKRLFQLAGSQTWADGWQDANTYSAGSGPITYSIPIGSFYTGAMTHLAFSADNDASGENYASFSNLRLYEDSSSGGSGGTVNVGALNNGIAALDNRTGTGYLMYSAANVITRFGAYNGNADHIIAVYYNNDQWLADTNFGQTVFTPESTDVLLAEVDFTNDTVNSLEGQAGTEYGIDYGYYSGDLVYTADWWNGSANDGEFSVSGTSFTKNASGGGSSPVSVGAMNDGVAGTDWRSGEGYLMYSSTDTDTRFNAFNGNADHIIAVYYNTSDNKWYADRNYGQIEFTPQAGDVLLASISFTNDTVSSLEGQNSSYQGIPLGYVSGDLSYQVDVWGGHNDSADGEFGVTGTSFTPW